MYNRMSFRKVTEPEVWSSSTVLTWNRLFKENGGKRNTAIQKWGRENTSIGTTLALYFQSVRSYYGHYLHSELYKAKQALCDGRCMCSFQMLTVCICVCMNVWLCVWRMWGPTAPCLALSVPLVSTCPGPEPLSIPFWSSSPPSLPHSLSTNS